MTEELLQLGDVSTLIEHVDCKRVTELVDMERHAGEALDLLHQVFQPIGGERSVRQ